jgi:hypothetical protein
MGKYVSVIGLFLVGIVVVVAGVYLFLTGGSDAASFQTASIVTLIGLLITGIGAIKGKRTMKSIGYFAAYPSESHVRQVSQVSSRTGSQPAGTVQPVQSMSSQDQSATPTTQLTPSTQTAATRPTPNAPATQASGSSAKQSSKAVAKVVRVIVCPKCGSENQEADNFCFNCGKKIRPKITKSTKSSGSKKK